MPRSRSYDADSRLSQAVLLGAILAAVFVAGLVLLLRGLI